MAFVINKRGERVPVDMEVDWFSQKCVLYADDADLKEMYILNLYKGRIGALDSGATEPELVKQIEFRDTLPTKEKIMYEMWKEGLSRYDIATIEKGYYLDWKD